MSDDPDIRIGKRAAAEAAVAEIEAGMVVGLGTGTTAAFAIEALASRVQDGLRVVTVATSLASARAATEAGLTVLGFEDLATVDLAIDGADELDPQLRAIKGGGGAMLREKIVAASAARMIAIIDGSKMVERLGARPVPLEVLPFAASFVAARAAALGADVVRRSASGGDYRTDQGNAVLDCRFGSLEFPKRLALELSSIPGMLGHGLFLDEIDFAYVGRGVNVSRLQRGAETPIESG